MSVVAVRINKDTIEVSADSILVQGWTKLEKSTKLIHINDMHIGFSGTSEEGGLFKLYCATRKPEQASEGSIVNFFSEFSDWKNNKTGVSSLNNQYILIFNKKVFDIYHFDVREIVNYTAIGAGMEFALAALHLGHTSEDAVKVACDLSVYCSTPVHTYTIEKL